VLDEIFGYGPLEPLLKDEEIADILVNGSNQVYIEKHGKLQRDRRPLQGRPHLLQIIDRIVSGGGPPHRRVVAAGGRAPAGRLPRQRDHPAARASTARALDPQVQARQAEPARTWSATRASPSRCWSCWRRSSRARLNILISGGTGAGKTTLLNLLSSFIPEDERIVTIEDSAELQLRQPHVVRLETRPANVEGTARCRSGCC
jgi:pilus assembly protein CpaF